MEMIKIEMRVLIWLFMLTCWSGILAQEKAGVGQWNEENVIRLAADSLPSLNIPRSGHNTFVAGGEVVVVGGHTSGFVPTATAEYFSDGEWHLVPTVYPHDHGFAAPLRSGKVLVGGGHSEPLGIGHIYSVEMYDPDTHAFTGFGCLDRKRCFAQGVEIDSGRVVITGNWFQSADAIEVFDGEKYFSHVKEVSQPRAVPFVFRVGKDDVIIFGSMDHHADAIDQIIVDRLKGEPFSVPLFDEWRPERYLLESQGADCFIGDESAGVYAYLFPVENKEGQMAIAKFDASLLSPSPGEAFSLLPTDRPVPTAYHDSRICWYHALTVDRQARRAYLFGYGIESHELFVLAVDYAPERVGTGPAPTGAAPAELTLYQIPPTGYVVYERPVLTADGDLLLVGGAELNRDCTVDNFKPHAAALLLRVGSGQEQKNADVQIVGAASAGGGGWLWLGGAALVLLLLAVWYMSRKSHKSQLSQNSHNPVPQPEPIAPSIDLMLQIDQLMKEQELFRRIGLKLQDVADLLNSNRTYVTDCIKSARGMTFTQYVNTYRVNYAKEQLLNQPEKKVSAIATDAGFTNEVSFFRAFKTLTGTTPSEFRAKKD